MYPIVRREQLADKIYLMDVKAPRVAQYCEPGQFVIVKIDEVGERIPLTICDYNREEGTITIVFQTVGASTQRMVDLQVGDAFQDFVGPLGCASDLIEEDIEELKKKKILFVAGGVVTAPVYPQVKWLHEHGVDCDVIMGSRNKELLILEDEMRKVATNLYVTTDDGSYGFKGTGTAQLQELWDKGVRYDHCVAIGPMKLIGNSFVKNTTQQENIKLQVYVDEYGFIKIWIVDKENIRDLDLSKTKIKTIGNLNSDNFQILPTMKRLSKHISKINTI